MASAIQQGIAGLLLYASLAQGILMAHPSQTGQLAVTTAEELIAATQNKKVTEINISADLADLSPLRLMPGQTLRSVLGRHAVLSFRPEADGLQVTTDNFVLARCACYPDSSCDLERSDCGDKVRSERIEVDGLNIRSAGTRGERERPHDYGLSVLQGAFTLWNLQPDEDVAISADLVNLSVGRFGVPVLGSGIFVAGAGKRGGRLHVERLETNAVYIGGRITPGTADGKEHSRWPL